MDESFMKAVLDYAIKEGLVEKKPDGTLRVV